MSKVITDNDLKGVLNRVLPFYLAESDSNANGSYVKFSDGTLICWGSKSVTTASGSGTFPYSGVATWTFPYAFSSVPVVTSSIEKAATYWNTTVTSITTSSCSVYGAGNTTATVTLHCIAIGRWK